MTECAFPGERACFCDGPCRFLAVPERTEPHEPDDPGMSAIDILEQVAERLERLRFSDVMSPLDATRAVATEIRAVISELRG